VSLGTTLRNKTTDPNNARNDIIIKEHSQRSEGKTEEKTVNKIAAAECSQN
jgi:hypothetical protein